MLSSTGRSDLSLFHGAVRVTPCGAAGCDFANIGIGIAIASKGNAKIPSLYAFPISYLCPIEKCIQATLVEIICPCVDDG